MRKKHPYYGKSIIIDFLDFPHSMGCIFPYCGKFMGKPIHFPYDDIS